MLQQQLGAMQINRIIEYQSSEYVRTSFFPQTTPEDWVGHEQWMKPHAMDQETGRVISWPVIKRSGSSSRVLRSSRLAALTR